MFHPMAFTVVIALISAMILSVTFIPAAVALIVTGKVEEKEQTLIVLAKQRYLPLLRWAILNKVLVLTIAMVSVV